VQSLLHRAVTERTSRSSLVDRYICLEKYTERSTDGRSAELRTTLGDYSYSASPHYSVKYKIHYSERIEYE